MRWRRRRQREIERNTVMAKIKMMMIRLGLRFSIDESER